MAKYNPYRWWTTNAHRKKPLKKSSPLLLRIRNGDFEYSPFFEEAKDNAKLYDDMYNDFMKKSLIKDEKEKTHEAHQYAKMKHIKELKLLESGHDEEVMRLYQLRNELEKEFGKDLWDECLKRQRGKGTTEDIYWWYKKKTKMGFTPSEIAIKFGRNSTKGLR